MILAVLTVSPVVRAQASSGVVRPSRVILNVYVSAQIGNDGYSGRTPEIIPCGTKGCTPDGPFLTFTRARNFVRQLNSSGQLADVNEVHVQFATGYYYIIQSETIVNPATDLKPEMLTAADSGTSATEIVYENYQGGTPVISGGLQLQNWSNPSEDGVTWITQLPASTTANFENLYYNGVRRLRPRLASPTETNPYLGTYFRVASTVYSADCSGQKTPEQSNGTYECLDRFQYADDTPISSAWKNLSRPAVTPPGSNCDAANGSKAPVGEIELVDFEQYSVAKMRISCVDTTNHIVYMTGTTAFEADHTTANGFLEGHRYLIENVEDDLTQPGQWFLDRSNNTTWTVTYLTFPGENPNTDTVIIPQLPQVLVASGVNHMTFRGLTFAHDNYVIDDRAYPNGGYGGLAPIIAAVSFQNSTHIKFDGSIVSQTSGAGLEFISCIDSNSPNWCVSTNSAGVTNHDLVENSAFSDLGANGVRIGNSGQSTDTSENVTHDVEVLDNVVEGYGRVFPDSTGIVQGQGHNNHYSHNEVYDGYKGAIHVCYCSDVAPSSGLLPNDNTISYNLVYNLFQGIMNDSGSIYLGVGTPNTGTGLDPASGTGNSMLNNVVHDVNDASVMDPDGYGGDGLYLDDFTGGVDVENNLVYRVSDSAISFSGPRAGANQQSTITNNILAFARRSMLLASNPYSFGILPPTPNPLFFVATSNIFYFDRSESSSPVTAPFFVQGGCTYPGDGGPVPMATYINYQVWANNLYWRTDGGFNTDTVAFRQQQSPNTNPFCINPPPYALPYPPPASGLTFYKFAGWKNLLNEDANSVIQRPGFKHPEYPEDDYSLPNGSPGAGFNPFDPHHAGRRNPTIFPNPVQPTFPTALFNPATDF